MLRKIFMVFAPMKRFKQAMRGMPWGLVPLILPLIPMFVERTQVLPGTVMLLTYSLPPMGAAQSSVRVQTPNSIPGIKSFYIQGSELM